MHMRRPLHVAVLLLLLPTAGCLENMDDLKAALGVVEPPPPPAPERTPLPPAAKAAANATLAYVGSPLRFTAAASRDPLGLPLEFAWDFGDGSASRGAVAVHAYERPGPKQVRLTVTNSDGLADADTVTVEIRAPNAPPVAAMEVATAEGEPAQAPRAGMPLAFSAAASRDPDGDPLTYAWDFGDGALATTREAAHAYAAPGRYEVRLRVADPSGATAETAKVLGIGHSAAWSGGFKPLGASEDRRSVPVARAADSLTATLSFDGALGAVDLEVAFLSPDGRKVGASEPALEPGREGRVVKNLSLGAEALAQHPAGQWTVVVSLTRGAQAEFTVELEERVPDA